MTEKRRTRILMITRNLPPLVGGMERLNWHMAEELARRAELCVVGPEGAAAHAPQGVWIHEAPLKPLPSFLLRAQWRALRLARSWRPDLVLAGSGLTAPLAWLAARSCGAKAVTYVHGLDLAVPYRAYRRLWLPVLRHMDRVIANSRATAEIALRVGINPGRIGIVHPGVAVPDGAPDPQIAAHFRAVHGLGERPLLLSVGRLTRRKGLREFVAEALPRIVACRPDALLVVVGDPATFALYPDVQTPRDIQAAADAVGVGAHVRFLGTLSEADLAAAYQAASVHVFPVQQIAGNPEGFGMVALEAAAYGVPTVAFAVGGVADAVANGESGVLLAAGDYAGFAAAVLRLLEQPPATSRVRGHAEHFAWPRFGEALETQFEALAAAC